MRKIRFQLPLLRLRTLFQEQSPLKKLAMRGLFWTLFIYGASTVVRLGSSLLMTRLLAPELFGLMNLIYVFIVGLHLFSDLGSGAIITSSERGDDPKLLNHVWSLQIVRGVVLWILCLLLTVPISHIYNEPRMLWLMPIVGFDCVIGGLFSTSYFTLIRRMESHRWSQFELKNQIIGVTIMIGLAYFYRSIWALVISYLLSATIKTVWSHFLIPNYRNQWVWDWKEVREIFSFGRWILLSTMMNFLAGQVDRVLSGKLLSWNFLGIYGVVLSISDMPKSIIGNISTNVIFPAISQMVELPRDVLLQKIRKNRLPVLAIVALGLAFIVSFGDVIVGILYDHRYAEGRWMLPLIALGVWPYVLLQTQFPILLALGKPKYQTIGNFFKLIFTGVGSIWAFHVLGSKGFVLVVALNDLPLYGVVLYGLFKQRLNMLLQDVVTTLLLIGFTALFISIRLGLGFSSPFSSLPQ